MPGKITRIHKEIRTEKKPQRVKLKDHQEVTEKMDHRAWVEVTFTCPYCRLTETLDGDMQLPIGGNPSDHYTIITKHICSRDADSEEQTG